MVLMVAIFAAALVLKFVLIPAQVTVTARAAADPFTPATFPNLLGSVIAIAAVIGFIEAFFKFRAAKSALTEAEIQTMNTKHVRTKEEWVNLFIPYLFYILVLIYAYLFSNLGFIIATIIAPAAMLLLLGCKKPLYHGVVYAFLAFVYVIFRFVLKVPLP